MLEIENPCLRHSKIDLENRKNWLLYSTRLRDGKFQILYWVFYSPYGGLCSHRGAPGEHVTLSTKEATQKMQNLLSTQEDGWNGHDF